MLTIAYYFLQVVLCSSIMMGYYWLVLRNKRFHQYNRFYLLNAALLSWCIPLIKINVAKPVDEAAPPLLNLLNIVAGNNSEIEHIVVQKGFAINWDMVLISLYACVSTFFLCFIIIALVRIYGLLKKYSCKSFGDVYLIMTSHVEGTPFSFFMYVFWNEAVDMQTATGQQMMQHELAHVREKHSIDKLFMQIIIMFGWFNPFFWLLKKELNLIHEFIADNKAIKNGDASSLAAMLLTAAYPNQQYLLTNPFFFSPIKRRILILTKTNHPRLSYARRVVVLPLLAVTVMLFAFRKNEIAKSIAPLNKVYTVVIDAGHGGKDFGAIAVDGTTEKDLALQMLKAIKNANKNDKIKLVFTREEDVYQSPIEKANFVNEQKADLFISLHINSAAKANEKLHGFEIDVPKQDGKRQNFEQSNFFAGSINNALAKTFQSNGIKTKEMGIWILKATNCPAALIECGYISNAKDLTLLKDEKQRNKMAELILEGIGNYFKNQESQVADMTFKTEKDKRYVVMHFKGGDSIVSPEIKDSAFLSENGTALDNQILSKLFNNFVMKNDGPNAIDDKITTLSYKGEKLVSIVYTGENKSRFVFKTIKHQRDVTLDEIEAETEKLDAKKIKSSIDRENIDALHLLYTTCIFKQQQFEIQQLRRKEQQVKNDITLVTRLNYLSVFF
ncbi:MAG: N-acetylmuramoyl-L-alanine amidase [Chitinophagaceae bacterium]|nr:N-acetylmuramoyl-L-alanine amidase [Chitinophagaceae bacterium]